MSLEQQLSDAIAAQNALTQVVAGKKAEIDAAVAAQKAEFDAWRAQAFSQSHRNLLPDSGRFFDAGLVANAGANRGIAVPAFAFAGANAAMFNGSTIASVGKYTHDNSTFGGAGAALPDAVRAFIDATRPGDKRYGVEFHVAEVVQSLTPSVHSSMGGDGVLRWLASCNTVTVGMVTHAVWLCCVSGSIVAEAATHRNGSPDANCVVKPGDGWVHISALCQWGACGYSMPQVRTEPGTRYRMALPAILAGDVRGWVHVSPVLAQAV